MRALSRAFGILLTLNFFSLSAAALLGSRINSYMHVADHSVWQLGIGLVLVFIWVIATAYHGYRLLQKEPLKYPHGVWFLLILYFPATMLLFGEFFPRIDLASNDLSAYLTAYTFWIIPIVQFYDLCVIAPHWLPERTRLLPTE